MNAKQMAQQIADVCESLFTLKLAMLYEAPHLTIGGNITRVSWRHRMGSGHLHPFGTLEQYRDWVRAGEYTCILFDGSLVRASYDCDENVVLNHSLLYWPCPIHFHSAATSAEDLVDGIEMCIKSPGQAKGICDLMLRTPMRFDFHPDQEAEDHPLVHLHTQFEDARLSVCEAMCFPAFIKKIFRTFYADKWQAHPDLDELHEQEFAYEEARFDAPPHSLQVSWC